MSTATLPPATESGHFVLPAMPEVPPEWMPEGVIAQGPVVTGPQVNISAWTPTAKQDMFLRSPVFEVFFGGAKGGGKSNAMIADFAMHERKYGKSARGIMFRRTQNEFGQIRSMGDEMLAGLATWEAKTSSYVWPSGARLRLAYLDKDADVGRYTGQEFSWIGFDELTEWASPHVYLWMFSCLRSPDPRVQCVVRATGNPGRPGHGWVKTRFIDTAQPGEVFVDPEDGMERCFIPARLEDNPHLFRNDPGYEKRLMASSQNPHVVRALRWGIWDVFVGQAFDDWDPRTHLCARKAIPQQPSWPIYISMDWGYAKPYCILYFTVSPAGRVYMFREVYGCEPGKHDVGVRRSAAEVAKQEYEFAGPLGATNIIIDGSMKDQLGAGATVADQFQKAGFSLRPANKNRIQGKNACHRLLQAMMPNGERMFQVADTCEHFRRTLPSLVHNSRDKGKEEDVDDAGEDHAYDAWRYFAMEHDMMPGSPRIAAIRRRRAAVAQYAPDWNPYDVEETNWQGPYGGATLPIAA